MENFNFFEEKEYDLTAEYNEGGYYDVQFSVAEEMSKKIINNYYKSKKKMFKIKGFRNGKAPRSIIENRMGGKKAVYGATFMTYANMKILEKAPYKVLHTDNFDIKQDGDLWNVSFNLLLEQPVDITDEHLNMSFEIPKLSVDDYVSYRQKAFSRMNPILKTKEGEAVEDDMVEVSVDAYLDGEKFEDGSHDATNIRLVEGGVKPESLYKKLLGSVSGFEFEIQTTNPDEIPAFKKDFKDKKSFVMKVKVNHVYECEDPEIDNELAITAGYDNLEGWTNSLTDSANRINKSREEQLKRSLVLEHLVSNIKCPDMPDEWVAAKVKEISDKYDDTPQIRHELKNVAKQTTILKYVGKHLDIKWDDEEKSTYERNEQGYGEKVLNYLIKEKVIFSYKEI